MEKCEKLLDKNENFCNIFRLLPFNILPGNQGGDFQVKYYRKWRKIYESTKEIKTGMVERPDYFGGRTTQIGI